MSNSNQLVRSLNIPGITSILNLPLFPVPYIYCHEREHVLAGHMYTLQLSGGHTSKSSRYCGSATCSSSLLSASGVYPDPGSGAMVSGS